MENNTAEQKSQTAPKFFISQLFTHGSWQTVKWVICTSSLFPPLCNLHSLPNEQQIVQKASWPGKREATVNSVMILHGTQESILL